MKQKLITYLRSLARGPLAPLFYVLWQLLTHAQRCLLKLQWKRSGAPMPDAAQQALVRENVTFIFKSFERQHLARRLYRNIQAYYPGVRVIIADDSRKPLELSGPGLTVVHLPFNSGLSRGLNLALSQVTTPFTVRMDDDELLTPYSNFHGQLEFLLNHPEVDLVGVLPRNLPGRYDAQAAAKVYWPFSMAHAPKPLRLPHLTRIDDHRIVLGKVPNVFLVRTGPYQALGYDDNIRMIDHHEFFTRAAGELVAVLDENAYILHEHNGFNRYYQRFRIDVDGDRMYIAGKYNSARRR